MTYLVLAFIISILTVSLLIGNWLERRHPEFCRAVFYMNFPHLLPLALLKENTQRTKRHLRRIK